MEAPASEHPGLSVTFKFDLFAGDLNQIVTPFPYVARHIVNTELVWRFLTDGLSVIALSAVVPGYRIDVVAAAEREAVLPVLAAAGSILPFSLRGQAKCRCVGKLLGHHCRHRARVQPVDEAPRTREIIPRNIFQWQVVTFAN